MTVVPLLTVAKVAAIAPNLNLGCPHPRPGPESCSLINFHDHDTGEPIQLDTSPNTTRHLFPGPERRPRPSSTPRPKRSPNYSGPSVNVVVRHLVAPEPTTRPPTRPPPLRSRLSRPRETARDWQRNLSNLPSEARRRSGNPTPAIPNIVTTETLPPSIARPPEPRQNPRFEFESPRAPPPCP